MKIIFFNLRRVKYFIEIIMLLLVLDFMGIFAYCQNVDDQVISYEAAMSIKFIEYLKWPAGSGPASGEPTIISVLGDSPLTAKLKQLASFSSLKVKPKVQVVTADDDLSTTNILFITTTDKSELNKILEKVKDFHLLTVSSSDGFAQLGVMINFFAEKVKGRTKVKFEVNLDAVKGKGLKIASSLLKLAKIVNS
ncbi:MAG: YfiR family protein [FCB group bacterium]|nr:YfiR family protein [FCB group bacterium]